MSCLACTPARRCSRLHYAKYRKDALLILSALSLRAMSDDTNLQYTEWKLEPALKTRVRLKRGAPKARTPCNLLIQFKNELLLSNINDISYPLWHTFAVDKGYSIYTTRFRDEKRHRNLKYYPLHLSISNSYYSCHIYWYEISQIF